MRGREGECEGARGRGRGREGEGARGRGREGEGEGTRGRTRRVRGSSLCSVVHLFYFIINIVLFFMLYDGKGEPV